MAWRILTVVVAMLALAALVSYWVQRDTLPAYLGPGPNDVVFLIPGGSLKQQRKQAADFCSNVGVQRIADALDVDARRVAVSSAYADNVGPSALPSGPLQNRAIRAGCLAGLTR